MLVTFVSLHVRARAHTCTHVCVLRKCACGLYHSARRDKKGMNWEVGLDVGVPLICKENFKVINMAEKQEFVNGK